MQRNQSFALVALFAALMAVLGLIPKIDLPLGVPITLQTLGVMLAGCLLGPRRAFQALAITHPDMAQNIALEQLSLSAKTKDPFQVRLASELARLEDPALASKILSLQASVPGPVRDALIDDDLVGAGRGAGAGRLRGRSAGWGRCRGRRCRRR